MFETIFHFELQLQSFCCHKSTNFQPRTSRIFKKFIRVKLLRTSTYAWGCEPLIETLLEVLKTKSCIERLFEYLGLIKFSLGSESERLASHIWCAKTEIKSYVSNLFPALICLQGRIRFSLLALTFALLLGKNFFNCHHLDQIGTRVIDIVPVFNIGTSLDA